MAMLNNQRIIIYIYMYMYMYIYIYVWLINSQIIVEL